MNLPFILECKYISTGDKICVKLVHRLIEQPKGQRKESNDNN